MLVSVAGDQIAMAFVYDFTLQETPMAPPAPARYKGGNGHETL